MHGDIRNEIRKLVQNAHAILEKDLTQLLEDVYGINGDGTIEDISHLPHIQDNKKATRSRDALVRFLRQRYISNNARPYVTRKLIFDLAFTHLNRLIALKLMERRKIIEEAISRYTESEGFTRYLVDVLGERHPSQMGNLGSAYRDFISYQCKEFGEEIEVLFGSEGLSYHISPGPRALREVIEIINSDSLDAAWDDDKNISWFHRHYFISEEIKKQQETGYSALRDRWELAFCNEFYTPSYAVKFLGDNTLGRMWYEMMQGNTVLGESCEYMSKPRNEIFLQRGEKPSAENDILQVPFRDKKDPRELKILDPACGSGHFLLYIFHLLAILYREAYTDRDLGKKLQSDYPDRNSFEREIPRLILESNIYGMDIELRAVQIAALALWLRAHREWADMRIPVDHRPKIRNTYFVCVDTRDLDQEPFGNSLMCVRPSVFGKIVF